MDKRWLQVFIAAIFEVGWVVGLKHASTSIEWALTIIALVVSFYLMINASSKLPVGTVYAIFVGLGTVGTVVTDILFFNQPIIWTKMLLIAMLLVGVVGLKMLTAEDEVA